jgi:threonine aldolase
VRTNVVIFEHDDPGALLDHLRAEGVLAGTIGPRRVRFVTHLDVDDAGVERTVKALASAP